MKKLTDIRIGGERGFTMLELMIALAIGVVVIWAIYDLYAFVMRSSAGMDRSLETQLELRAGTERIVKELRAGGCYYKDTPIIAADIDSIAFESDVDPDPSPDKGPWLIRYRYDAAANSIFRSESEWGGVGVGYGAPTEELFVGDITRVQFDYFGEPDVNGNPTPLDVLPLSQADRGLVRKVVILMDSATGEVNPNTGEPDTIGLKTAVQMRCMGVNQSSDETPCGLGTTALMVTDPGQCGTLDLSWAGVSGVSADVAGYRVYYKNAASSSSTYTGVFDVPGANNTSATVSGLTNGESYDIALKCYDTSGNLSTAYTVAGPGQDTTPNDTSNPIMPIGVDASAIEGQVTITWKYDINGPSPDLAGHTIFRSADTGVTYAEIGEVGPTDRKYFDQGVALNCPVNPYYYKVTAWDCVAANNFNQSDQRFAGLLEVYGDGNRAGGIKDKPTNKQTNTFPADDTPPDDPTVFKATAAATSIFLSYTTPAKDVAGTRILVSKGGYPSGPEDVTAFGPNDTPDHAPENPTQTYSREDLGFNGALIVPDGTKYYYRAFTFDNCGNYSPGGLTSRATAKPCGDGDSNSDHFGPPAPPKNVQVKSCKSVTLNWDASLGTVTSGGTIPFSPISESDVVGYNIYRRVKTVGNSVPYERLNAIPVSSTSYADSTASTDNTYEYKVTAVDCATPIPNEITQDVTANTAMPNDIVEDPSFVVTVSPTLGPEGADGSQQNVVKLAVNVLGNTSITIDSAEISWDVVPAKLKKVTLTAAGFTEKTIWDDPTLPLSGSGATIDFASFEPTAGNRRLAETSTGNVMLLDFRNKVGNPTVDMRQGSSINLAIHYTADGDSALCTTATISILLPDGPTILSATQNRPQGSTQPNHMPGNVVISAGTQDNITEVWTFDDVEVTAHVSPQNGTSIDPDKAMLFYAITDPAVISAPFTDYSDFPPMEWTALQMCRLGSSDAYQTSCTPRPIPYSLGKRVWYYIRMVDNLGNTDIHPEAGVGIFTYDQESYFMMRPLTVTRSGANTTVEVVLKDAGFNPATGATVSLTVKKSAGGTKANVTMVEDPAQSGTYIYPDPAGGTGDLTGFAGSDIDISISANQSGFTQSKCSAVNVAPGNNTSTVFCE